MSHRTTRPAVRTMIRSASANYSFGGGKSRSSLNKFSAKGTLSFRQGCICAEEGRSSRSHWPRASGSTTNARRWQKGTRCAKRSAPLAGIGDGDEAAVDRLAQPLAGGREGSDL